MLRAMRLAWLAAVAACGTSEPARIIPPTTPDASLDAPAHPPPLPSPPLDAAPREPAWSCSATMTAKGWLRVRIDPATLRGEIERVTAGRAPRRHLQIVARRSGDTTTLIFDGYLPDDHTSIRGQRVPRPAGETLVRGTSIVGRLVATPPDLTRLDVAHEVDWVTDALLDVHDGYTVCRPGTW